MHHTTPKPHKMVHHSIIGQPYFWQRGEIVMAHYRGRVFAVPNRNVSRETLDALAAEQEAAMLERYANAAKHGRDR